MYMCRECFGQGLIHFSGEIVKCITCQGSGEIEIPEETTLDVIQGIGRVILFNPTLPLLSGSI